MHSKAEGLPRRRFLRACGSIGGLLAAVPEAAWSSGKSILEMVRAAEKLEGVDMVDVHTHINETPPNAIWPQNPEAMLEDMDRCGVGLAIFSHLGAIEALTPETLKAANDNSIKAVREHPRRLRSYLVFHPHHFETSKQQMKRVLEPDSPFVGFKLHGAFHQYPADGTNYQPVFQFAHEHRLAVLFHVAGIGRDWNQSVGDVAVNFPGLNIILAHLAPGEDLLPGLMKGRPNLHVDTCLSTGRRRQIERIASKIGPERMLFATDGAYNSVVTGVAKIAFADVPEDEKRLIFGGNARRIFGKRLPPPHA